MDNLKFEIWGKNWKFVWERLEILKKIEIWGIIKTWKNCKFGKCGNLKKFGNQEKNEIWKNKQKFREILEILKNFGNL